MTNLHRLEADDAQIGGILYTFPSGKTLSVTWKSQHAVTETRDFALKCASHVREKLMSDGKQDDIDRTNWPSCVAATQKHIKDWNETLKPQLSA